MAESSSHLFTSESVASGHPDKICDSISDAIVDACLTIDPDARVAVETLVKGKAEGSVIILAGEVSLSGDAPDYEAIARQTAATIGYVDHSIGMDATSSEICEVHTHITTQSAYISQGIDGGDIDSQGAGDQGMMFGYACNETEQDDELRGRHFPIAAALAQRLTRRLDIIQRSGEIPWMRPDGKSQVTVEYENGSPCCVNTVVVAVQHDAALKERFGGSEEAEHEFITEQVREHVVEHAIPTRWLQRGYRLQVNNTGRFADPGGPYSDAGITGRKIVVDAYGGMARHGGGAFSGKDPSKVDRSAAYGARWAAKHVVVAGLADRCEIQVAYVIGQAEPVSLRVDTFGTGVMGDSEISHRVMNAFDWRPAAIIKDLDLKLPIYLKTATGGHFGRPPTAEGHFPWERIHEERIEALKST
ncbi:MAG: methionine adenosyltransferase [Candidatus Thermoplasmatota archaeon]|nr:methionine adenosyltransferase [Candidatus Thermoplasmatota archaeon]